MYALLILFPVCGLTFPVETVSCTWVGGVSGFYGDALPVNNGSDDPDVNRVLISVKIFSLSFFQLVKITTVYLFIKSTSNLCRLL
jgi:hypothetical protein